MNTKLITVSSSKEDYDCTLRHYACMGFDLLKCSLVTTRNAAGIAIRENYEYVYQFDGTQKNADQLWKMYRKYTKKKSELEDAYRDNNRDLRFSKTFWVVALLVAVVFVPLFPMILGNGFGDFYRTTGGFFGPYTKEFDYFTFFAALFLSIVGGFVAALIEQLLENSILSKRRFLTSVERIPRLTEELENITCEAQAFKTR